MPHTSPQLARRVLSVMLLLGLACLGCKGNATPKGPEGQNNLAAIAKIIDSFLIPHHGQGPKDEAELKSFVDSNGKTILDQFKITDVASIYKSPRDGKPYVLLVGKDYDKYQTDEGSVIAYEQTGVEGVRLVVFRGGEVKEIPEAVFKTMIPNHK